MLPHGSKRSNSLDAIEVGVNSVAFNGFTESTGSARSTTVSLEPQHWGATSIVEAVEADELDYQFLAELFEQQRSPCPI
ncbi:MAG: hypothetical protein CMJ77_08885 [Planctomycetaceae bacterium]|nr:hypothetical protein [Planctomycetaceae bacterium]